MEFTLIYSGPLKGNGGPDHKHQIRCQIHSQMRTLWSRSPLVDLRHFYTLESSDKSVDLNRSVGPYNFVPLVRSSLWLVCALDVSLLRPEAPGAIITQGGDIDNRLKTLFDSLRYPRNVGELPKGSTPGVDERPFFVCWEDDNLITAVSVRTDRLLLPDAGPGDVHLHLRVTTRPTRGCFANLGLV